MVHTLSVPSLIAEGTPPQQDPMRDDLGSIGVLAGLSP